MRRSLASTGLCLASVGLVNTALEVDLGAAPRRFRLAHATPLFRGKPRALFQLELVQQIAEDLDELPAVGRVLLERCLVSWVSPKFLLCTCHGGGFDRGGDRTRPTRRASVHGQLSGAPCGRHR